MTEKEWLESTDRWEMVDHIVPTASERKLRLFGCACCRRHWSWLHPAEQVAIEVAERFADGQATKKELKVARDACKKLPEFVGGASPKRAATPTARHAACQCADWARWEVNRRHDVGWKEVQSRELLAQRNALRCIFGNPFRPVSLAPSWLTPTVKAFAEQIYNENAFDRMPILADALEEAGCANPDVFAHCRGSETHVRGCWLLDLLLKKG